MENIHKKRHIKYVPEELIIQILLRLPVKSLLRFKTVSKSWYNIITSSDFINNHYLLFNSNNHNTHILVYYALPSPTIEHGFLALSYESLSWDHHYLDYLRIPANSIKYILGPVNGLFLLCPVKHSHLGLAIFNPATRELSTLFVPDSNQEAPHLESSNHVFGFGFDHLTNDYKVLAFWDVLVPDTRSPIPPTRIAVYSLSNDSWKRIDPFHMKPNRLIVNNTSYYLNGVYYWLIIEQINGGNDFGYHVLSFDFGKEVLQEIKGPQYTTRTRGYACLFLYKDDYLGMFVGECPNPRNDEKSSIVSINLLIMKEQGCWIKHLTLDVSPLQVSVIKPLVVWKNNNLLLQTGSRKQSDEGGYTANLVLYDPASRAFKELETPNLSYWMSRLKVFSYKESLISAVKEGRNDNRRRWSDFSQDLLESSTIS